MRYNILLTFNLNKGVSDGQRRSFHRRLRIAGWTKILNLSTAWEKTFSVWDEGAARRAAAAEVRLSAMGARIGVKHWRAAFQSSKIPVRILP